MSYTQNIKPFGPLALIDKALIAIKLVAIEVGGCHAAGELA